MKPSISQMVLHLLCFIFRGKTKPSFQSHLLYHVKMKRSNLIPFLIHVNVSAAGALSMQEKVDFSRSLHRKCGFGQSGSFFSDKALLNRGTLLHNHARQIHSIFTPTEKTSGCGLYLSVSRGHDDSSLLRGGKQQKQVDLSRSDEQRTRMKKADIDDLIRGMGLETVQSTRPKTKTHVMAKYNQQRKDVSSLQRNSSISLQQMTPNIPLQIQLDYARNGHALLRSFLPATMIKQIRSEILPYASSQALESWRQKVEVQFTDSSNKHYRQNAKLISSKVESIEECKELLAKLGLKTKDFPFLQHFNTWRAVDANVSFVKKLCLSPYLAQTASILLDSPIVRLYQDSLFHKRPGDGWTPWHSDARMAPFDTSKMITFWIPLQDVPKLEDGGTGLVFVDGSHSDFALPYWNGFDGPEYDRLDCRYGDGTSHHMPMSVGDVTVHNGWTLHCADAAEMIGKCKDRYAFSITYVDGSAEIREDVLSNNDRNVRIPKGDKEDIWSFQSWLAEVKPRTKFRHPLVPIVWPLDQTDCPVIT